MYCSICQQKGYLIIQFLLIHDPSFVVFLFQSPLMFIILLTCPVVNYEDEEMNNWNKPLNVLQCFLSPTFAVLLVQGKQINDDVIYEHFYYSDVIMSAMASRVNNASMVCSTVCSGTDQRKHQCSALMAFVRGIPLTKGQLCGKCFRLMTSSCSFCWSVIRGAQWSTLDSYILQLASNAVFPEQDGQQTVERPVTWDAMTLMWCHYTLWMYSTIEPL